MLHIPFACMAALTTSIMMFYSGWSLPWVLLAYVVSGMSVLVFELVVELVRLELLASQKNQEHGLASDETG